MRRDRVIKKLVAEIPYVEGEYVTPHSPEEREKYGSMIIVEKICDSYAKFGRTEKWPDDDVPFIVQAWSNSKLTRFNCTPGYLIQLTKEGGIPK
jgi:hypothetical protein